jgi:lysophospholipase L1-like esterase
MQLGAIARRAVLLGVGFLVGALAAEILARGYAHFGGRVGQSLAKRDPLNVLYEPHGAFGYRQKPNRAQRFGNGTQSNWNAMGYRGPLVERRKPEGTFRVVLLGESTTEGFGVDDHETIDAHMRELLRERFPEIRAEVVNLALGGYDSYQILERMRSDGVGFSPDVVIVNTGINDVRNAQFSDLRIPDPRTLIWEGNMQRLREEAARGGPSPWTRILHHSYAARLPGFFRENLGRRESVAQSRVLTPQPQALDYFETNVRATADLVRGVGAGLILSTPPSALSTRYARDDFSDRGYWIVDAATTEDYRKRLAARLREIAAELTAGGWPVAYLAPQLAPELFLDDCHLSGAGNRAVAEAFLEALLPHLARAFPGRVDARAQAR